MRNHSLTLAGLAAVAAAALIATRAPVMLLATACFVGLAWVAVAWLRQAILVVVVLVGVLPIGLYAEISPSVPLVTASRVLIGAVVIAAAIQVLRGRLQARKWLLWPAFGFWLAAVALSWPGSINPQTTELRLFSELLETAALAGVVYLVFDRNSYRQVLIALTVGAAINAGIALVGFAGFDPLTSLRARADAVTGRAPLVSSGDVRLGFQRVQGTFQHPAFLAAYLAMLAPVIYSLAIVSRRIPRRWLMLTLALCLATLVLTVTRAARLAGGAALFWVWIAAIRRGGQRLWRQAWAVSTVAVAAIVTNPGQVASIDALFRELFATQGYASTATTGYRLFLHEQVLAVVGQRPWFGFGANTFDQIGITGFRQGLTVNVTSADSHVLRLLAEVGVVGAVAFGILLVATIANICTARAQAGRDDAVVLTGVLAALSAFTVINLTISAFSIVQDSYIFWILVGAACASRFTSPVR